MSTSPFNLKQFVNIICLASVYDLHLYCLKKAKVMLHCVDARVVKVWAGQVLVMDRHEWKQTEKD